MSVRVVAENSWPVHQLTGTARTYFSPPFITDALQGDDLSPAMTRIDDALADRNICGKNRIIFASLS